MPWFDESRLDDTAALADADERLRYLAESGSRVRLEVSRNQQASSTVNSASVTPRAIVAVGEDSRLLRAVLEPWCPVPFVAWPNPGLPGWVGSLDLVLVLAAEGSDFAAASSAAEAVRRGAQVVVACPEHSFVAEHADGRWTTPLASTTGDVLAAAIVMLDYLHHLGLGPAVDPQLVADELDDIAQSCSPFASLAENPAKMHAIALAEASPLLWGGSVLAARAARRTAESIRAWAGRPAIAGPADHVLPLIEAAPTRDVFADPFEDDEVTRPALMVFDDGSEEALVRENRGRLLAAATQRQVREISLTTQARSEMGRYCALLLLGRYTAAYLAVGLSGESDLGPGSADSAGAIADD